MIHASMDMAIDLQRVSTLWTLWMEEILHQVLPIGSYETLQESDCSYHLVQDSFHPQ